MGAPQNIYSYGNTTFPYAKLSVESQAIYGDDDYTQIGTQLRFTIAGVVGGVSQMDLATQICMMKQALNIPRQQFTASWTGDGNTTLYSYGPNDDIARGPLPGALTLWAHSGGRAAAYTWSLGVWSKECFGTGQGCSLSSRQGQILLFTRNYDFLIDNNGFTRRTVSGRLMLTAQGGQADSYRDFIATIIRQPNGYHRVQQQFRQNPDARILDYSIVDQEQMWTFPQPVTGGNATFSVRIDPYGAKQEYMLTGRFEGPSGIGKDQLLNQALLLAATKIPAAAGVVVIPTDIEISEDVYNNAINFKFGAWSATGAAPGTAAYGQGPLGTFGGIPPGNNQQGQPVWVYGGTGQNGNTSGLLAAGAPALDACTQLSPGEIPTDVFPSGSNPSGIGGTQPPPPESNPSTSNPGALNVSNPGKSTISADHAGDAMTGLGPFVEYKEIVKFHVKNSIVMLQPKLAGKDPISQQTATPRLTITQSGYCRRYANTAALKKNVNVFDPPTPFFDSSTVQMLDSEFGCDSADPVGNTGWDIYKFSWTYIMRWNKSITTINDTSSKEGLVAYPDDPRRPYPGPIYGSSGDTALPEIVVAPAAA
jgi:hypothetical protein